MHLSYKNLIVCLMRKYNNQPKNKVFKIVAKTATILHRISRSQKPKLNNHYSLIYSILTTQCPSIKTSNPIPQSCSNNNKICCNWNKEERTSIYSYKKEKKSLCKTQPIKTMKQNKESKNQRISIFHLLRHQIKQLILNNMRDIIHLLLMRNGLGGG